VSKFVAVMFVVVLAAVAIAGAVWLSNELTSDKQIHVSPVDPTPSPTPSSDYRALVAGLSLREDGTRVSFTRYLAPNGDGIIYEVEKRKTAGLADREVRKQVRATARVFEDGPLVGRSGDLVGRRVVFERKSDARDGNPLKVVVRSYGTNIHIIESNSLESALDFEKSVDFELDVLFDKIRPAQSKF